MLCFPAISLVSLSFFYRKWYENVRRFAMCCLSTQEKRVAWVELGGTMTAVVHKQICIINDKAERERPRENIVFANSCDLLCSSHGVTVSMN